MDLLGYLGDKIRDNNTNGTKRLEYRQNIIKALINGYPANHLIPMKEFRIATNYTGTGVYDLMKKMVISGDIEKVGTSNTGVTYKVLKPGKTYEKEIAFEQRMKLKDAHSKQTNLEEERSFDLDQMVKDTDNYNSKEESVKSYTLEELKKLAIEAITLDGLSSVKDFLIWLKEQE